MNHISEENRGQQPSEIKLLTDEEIDFVSGGNPVLVAAAAAAGIFAALNAAESFGEKIGKALYYAAH